MSYFEEATADWNERKKLRDFKKSFLKFKANIVLGSTNVDNYEQLKNMIIEFYEISADDYRQKFRKTYQDNKPVKMYLAELEKFLEKWISLSKINEDYKDLKALILKEKFIQGLPLDSKKLACELDNQGTEWKILVEKIKSFQLANKTNKTNIFVHFAKRKITR